MTTSPRESTLPGPGAWHLDRAHSAAPFCGYQVDFFETHDITKGFSDACRRYGMLADSLDDAYLRGWQYTRVRLAPPTDLPQRHAAAEAALAATLWERDAEAWFTHGRAVMRGRLRGLQAVDLATLDDAGLLHHARDVRATLVDGVHHHFFHVAAHTVGVGDWLAQTQAWTGLPPHAAIAALQGASPDSIDPLIYVQQIADAVRDEPNATAILAEEGDAAARMERLRAVSPTIAAALDAYLDEHGRRSLTGFDLTDLTVMESPAMILASVAARLAAAPGSTVQDDVAAGIRARVAVSQQPEYDRLFATARKLYGLRDSDVGPCITWPNGLVRLALLEGGRRLVDRGRIADRDHVLQASAQEFEALILGDADAPSGLLLAERVERHRQSALNPPPAVVGEDEAPPPPGDALSPALARVNAAFMVSVPSRTGAGLQAQPDGAASVDEEPYRLQGQPASGGIYEGHACLVRGPADFAKLLPGDVLIAPFTTPAYSVVLPLIGAVVTDHGGILSHAAIVAREYAIPAVVATRTATTMIADGAYIRVDGHTGTVELAIRPGEERQA